MIRFKKRGSLTIEAAIVLPVVILTLLFIANILNMCNVHVCMQQALNNTAKKISQASYLVYRLAGEEAYAETLDKLDNVNQTYSETAGTVTNMYNQMESFQESIKNSLTSVGELLNTFDGFEITKLVEYAKKFVKNVTELKNSLVNVGNSSKNLFDSFVLVAKSTTKNFNSIMVKLLVDTGGSQGTGIAKYFFDKYTEELRLPSSKITDVAYYHTSVNSDGTLTMAIKYSYVNPFSIVNSNDSESSALNKNVKMMNAITIRPFVGMNGTSLKGKLSGEDNEVYVYIPGGAYDIANNQKYKIHYFRDCQSLTSDRDNRALNCRRVKLSEAQNSGRIDGICSHCENRKGKQQ